MTYLTLSHITAHVHPCLDSFLLLTTQALAHNAIPHVRFMDKSTKLLGLAGDMLVHLMALDSPQLCSDKGLRLKTHDSRKGWAVTSP